MLMLSSGFENALDLSIFFTVMRSSSVILSM